MSLAVAVSGGVDSLYALLSLRDSGEEVVAVHGLFLTDDPGRETRLAGLDALCRRVDVPLHVLDLRAEFAALVVEPFVGAHFAGLTPNPCALCNPRLKFGLLLDRALVLGADRFASGHYARFAPHPCYGGTLAKAADSSRDQSYFLSLVSPRRLAKVCFPLADVAKRDAVQALAAKGFSPPTPGESREICFIPGDHRDFLKPRATGRPDAAPGPIVDVRGRVLGRHDGLWRYTLGQRRGLGVPHREALYVIGKEVQANRLVVGVKAESLATELVAAAENIAVPPDLWPERLLVRTRYKQTAHPARVEVGAGTFRVVFDEPVGIPAPGQIAAVYDDLGAVLAAGTIQSYKPLFANPDESRPYTP